MLGCILTNNNLKGVSIMDYAILDKINELSDKLDHNKSVRWLTISDVCDYLHLSQSTIRRKIQSGDNNTSIADVSAIAEAVEKQISAKRDIDEQEPEVPEAEQIGSTE